MPENADREHFIPLRRCDLVDLLAKDKALKTEDREDFNRFCRLLAAVYHFEYTHRLEELKAAYAPFDPDTDTKLLSQLSAEEEQRRLNDLFSDFAWLLERADFKHLSREDVEPSLYGSSAWGIHVEVDFSVFERCAIFARGDVLQKRPLRSWRRWYKLEDTEVPVYQRLVLILKLRPHHRLASQADTDSVYLKIFKDIPQLDIKMLLPSARVRLSKLDRGKIGFPLLSGIGLALYNILMQVIQIGRDISEFLLSSLNTGTLWAIALGGIGYGYKSYYGYSQTRQKYRLNLTQSLYFQNLDNNAGVLTRLLDEAEEQECREAILAYFGLLHFAADKGWTCKELDTFLEDYLVRMAGVAVSSKIGDTLIRLEKMRIVEKEGDRYRAASMEQALNLLITAWNGSFYPKKEV